MRKRDFWTGLAFTLAGLGCLLAAVLTDSRFSGLLFGMAGGALGSGLMQLWKYFHWTKPENRAEYAARLEQEQISMADERNRMLRDRAKSYALSTGLLILSLSMVVFAALDALEVAASWRAVILCLAGFLMLELGIYCWAFRKLDKKY